MRLNEGPILFISYTSEQNQTGHSKIAPVPSEAEQVPISTSQKGWTFVNAEGDEYTGYGLYAAVWAGITSLRNLPEDWVGSSVSRARTALMQQSNVGWDSVPTIGRVGTESQPTALGAGLPTPPGQQTAGLRESPRRDASGDLRSDLVRGQETRAQRGGLTANGLKQSDGAKPFSMAIVKGTPPTPDQVKPAPAKHTYDFQLTTSPWVS
jgi:hypothetical protein